LLGQIKDTHKIFCIGFGKTGTTSLAKALSNFGFILGNQAIAEILAEDWFHGRVERILAYCHTAQAFQDIPFWMPGLFKELDKAFPFSKFILTVRDNEDQWFQSLRRFHMKRFARNKSKAPTEDDLGSALYRYKGMPLRNMEMFWQYPRFKLYDEHYYKQKYLKHIDDVKQYFSDRPEDLLVLNVGKSKSYQKLAEFLDIEVDPKAEFPWENKT